MDLRELCPDIRERDIWLYGDQEEIKEFLNIYAGQLHICGVVTEYADEVTIQPYMEWNIRAEKMDDLVYSPEQMIVICHHDFFQMLRWRLLYMGRKEYRDFISSNLVECLLYGKWLIVAMGTQLIAQTCLLLESNKELSDRYSVVYYAESDLMEPYRNQLPECAHVARCCDIYIRSDCEKERYPLKILGTNVLTETCKMITVADYGFAGYFPQIARDRNRVSDYLLRGYERLPMSYETVAFAREDQELLRLCREGMLEEDIIRIVRDKGFYPQESVNAHFDSEIERFKQLEVKANIKLGGFIETHRGKLLCRNLNEWHEPAVSYVADEILKCLNLPALSMDRMTRKQLLENACGSDLLVYPCVRKALGLAEEVEESKYRVVTYFGIRYMTWDEYVRYIVQYLYKAIDIMEFTGMDMTLEPVV